MCKRNKKIASLVLAAALCLGGLVGCGGGQTQSNGIESQSPENTLTIATNGEVTTLSPLYMVNTNLPVSKMVYEGLVKYVNGDSAKPCRKLRI